MIRELGLLLLLSLGCPAQVIWRGDFETGDLSRWSGSLHAVNGERRNIEITGEPGRRVARLTIHPDDVTPNGHNRVELRHDGLRTAEGETTYFSWNFRLEMDAASHADIGYWETLGSYRQSMAFYIDPAEGGSRLGFRTNLPSPREHWNAKITAGRWYQLKMKIIWSQSEGEVSVWLDGAPVVSGVRARTKPDSALLFFQVGLHRDRSAPPVEMIHIGDVIESAAFDDASPNLTR